MGGRMLQASEFQMRELHIKILTQSTESQYQHQCENV